jgi:hypothetical protein
LLSRSTISLLCAAAAGNANPNRAWIDAGSAPIRVEPRVQAAIEPWRDWIEPSFGLDLPRRDR